MACCCFCISSTRHESRLLAGFLRILGHLLWDLVLIDYEPEGVGLHDGDQKREEIVI